MKTPSTELLELCGAVRDEIATPEQVSRLEAILANDPEARRFYRQFSHITAMLERYEHLPAAASAPVARLSRSVTRPFSLKIGQWLGLAAGIAVLITIYFGVRRPLEPVEPGTVAVATTADAIALVQDSHHCTVIPRVGPAVALNESYALKTGDIIATAPNGNAILQFADETTLFIFSSDTRAWLSREGSTKIVHLTSGQLYGDVSAQKDGAQWRILTADGEARVLGTQLAVSALADGTRVSVTSGRVRVTARDSRQTVETPAGFSAQLTPATATLVKLDPSEPMRVTGFTLVDADTNLPLPGYDLLRDGSTLDLATLPTRHLNIQANSEPRLVGMVRFELAGLDANGTPLLLVQPKSNGFPRQIEIYYPYMLAGDPSFEGERLPQHSYSWTPPPGQYTMTATPYAAKLRWGARGEALTIRFNVVDSAARN